MKSPARCSPAARRGKKCRKEKGMQLVGTGKSHEYLGVEEGGGCTKGGQGFYFFKREKAPICKREPSLTGGKGNG